MCSGVSVSYANPNCSHSRRAYPPPTIVVRSPPVFQPRTTCVYVLPPTRGTAGVIAHRLFKFGGRTFNAFFPFQIFLLRSDISGTVRAPNASVNAQSAAGQSVKTGREGKKRKAFTFVSPIYRAVRSWRLKTTYLLIYRERYISVAWRRHRVDFDDRCINIRKVYQKYLPPKLWIIVIPDFGKWRKYRRKSVWKHIVSPDREKKNGTRCK